MCAGASLSPRPQAEDGPILESDTAKVNEKPPTIEVLPATTTTTTPHTQGGSRAMGMSKRSDEHTPPRHARGQARHGTASRLRKGRGHVPAPYL